MEDRAFTFGPQNVNIDLPQTIQDRTLPRVFRQFLWQAKRSNKAFQQHTILGQLHAFPLRIHLSGASFPYMESLGRLIFAFLSFLGKFSIGHWSPNPSTNFWSRGSRLWFFQFLPPVKPIFSCVFPIEEPLHFLWQYINASRFPLILQSLEVHITQLKTPVFLVFLGYIFGIFLIFLENQAFLEYFPLEHLLYIHDRVNLLCFFPLEFWEIRERQSHHSSKSSCNTSLIQLFSSSDFWHLQDRP